MHADGLLFMAGDENHGHGGWGGSVNNVFSSAPGYSKLTKIYQ